jgi:DNA ligase 1
MSYHELAQLYDQLESTSKRLEKTYCISRFLKKAKKQDLHCLALLFQGRIFPSWDERKIGVASRLVIKAMSIATGMDKNRIETEWKKTGDLGEVAENFVGKKKQQTLASHDLSVHKVFETLQKLSTLEGQGTVDKKTKLIAELLTSAKPLEAKYIVRTVLEDLRVGVGDGTLRDAIVWAFFEDEVQVNYNDKTKKIDPEDREKYSMYCEAVQHAFNLTNDFGKVAEKAKEGTVKALKAVQVSIGRPLKVMLYQKADDLQDAFERVGKPCALEYKYDGFRIIVHKKGENIILFTRRLETVTQQFPDVVAYVKKYIKGNNFILDAEAVGFDPTTQKYLPFQNVSQRIKRKYNIEKMAKEYPVELNVFDVMANNGESIMNLPFKERRKLLEKIVKNEPKKIRVAKQIITENVKEAEKFYQASLAEGEEGVMAKNLEGVYKPGSRVGYGVKVKPVMETLDLVIVGADWGEGKRKGWLSSFTLACYDEDAGEFLEMGKVGTGIKELEEQEGVSFTQMTDLLNPLILSESGKSVKVKPKIVIEVNYEEIQKSPTYGAGFALRFPRVVRLREDKRPKDASSLDYVKRLYKGQEK